MFMKSARKTNTEALKLTRTPEVVRALNLVKKRYPKLSDTEILKVGLAKLMADVSEDEDIEEIRRIAAYSLNLDGYLDDTEEDIYHLGMGKKVSF